MYLCIPKLGDRDVSTMLVSRCIGGCIGVVGGRYMYCACIAMYWGAFSGYMLEYITIHCRVYYRWGVSFYKMSADGGEPQKRLQMGGITNIFQMGG